MTFLRTHTDDDIMGSTLACRSSRVRLIWEMEAYDTFANKPQNSIAKKGGDDKMNYAKTNNQVKSVLHMNSIFTLLLGSTLSGTLATRLGWLCPLKDHDALLVSPSTPKTPNCCGLPDNTPLYIMVNFFVFIKYLKITLFPQRARPRLYAL